VDSPEPGETGEYVPGNPCDGLDETPNGFQDDDGCPDYLSYNILVSDTGNDRVIEVDRNTKVIVWSFTDVERPADAQRLQNGNTLIADTQNDRVIEVSPGKNVVWEVTELTDLNGSQTSLDKPSSAERMGNGNTLIADTQNDRVVEVNQEHEIVWKLERLKRPSDATRLQNGNTLVADTGNHRILVVSPEGLPIVDKNFFYGALNVTPVSATVVETDSPLSGYPGVHAKGSFMVAIQEHSILEVKPGMEDTEWACGELTDDEVYPFPTYPSDARVTAKGNLLYAEYGSSRIVEIERALDSVYYGSDGSYEWSFNGSKNPFSVRVAPKDMDGDGTLDDFDPDLDGDGKKNVDDNCPYVSNAAQKDKDNDGVGDVCDNCPDVSNPDQLDSDFDGVCDAKDNCDSKKNPDQKNSDGDEFGDACDNCDLTDNPGQEDQDFDGLGNACDNCVDDPNKNQTDVDGDGLGDACDCHDLVQGPNEEGVDCGEYCGFDCLFQKCKDDAAWCGSDVEPLFLRGEYNDGFIDILFVADYRYTNETLFVENVKNLVRDGYFYMYNMTVDAFPVDYKDKFNFYYLKAELNGSLHADVANSSVGCTGQPPASLAGYGGTGTKATFRDIVAILCPPGNACGGCSGFGPGLNHKLRARSFHPMLLLHETGHGLFNLQDEYCGCKTWYQTSIDKSNIFLNNASCIANATAEAWTKGQCRTICNQPIPDCTMNRSSATAPLWRYDPDPVGAPDLMIACGPGCGANYTYYEADARRVNHVFDNWPTTGTPAVIVNARLSSQGMTFLNNLLADSHPDYLLTGGEFKVEVLGRQNQKMLEYHFSDPRMMSDDLPQPIEETAFSVFAPIEKGVSVLQVLETSTGKKLLEVDLEPTVMEYCQQNPGFEACRNDTGEVTPPKPPEPPQEQPEVTPEQPQQPSTDGGILGGIVSFFAGIMRFIFGG
jgi:hypothetical protein